MMDKYSAGLVKKPTFFRETIEVGTLKYQGFDGNELKEKLLRENVLKIMMERRNREISSAVLNRIESLGEKELEVLVNGSLSDKKHMIMVSIMKTERLIRELINELYMDKLELGQSMIDDGDLNVFFRRKAETHEDVAKWRDVTIKKLKQVIKKILKELEFVKMNGRSMELLTPIASNEFLDAIGDEDISIKRVFQRGY
ncbi:MAG: DUF1819 family protein [Bacillota bacterium]|nr:DUF1819 family protein [Bacillota bacterium]